MSYKFKVGDKVKVTPGMSSCSNKCKPSIKTIVYRDVGNSGNYMYELDCCTNGVWENELKLAYPKLLLTETDYLDAFQRNFKDGV